MLHFVYNYVFFGVQVNIVDIASQQIVHRVIPKAGKSLGKSIVGRGLQLWQLTMARENFVFPGLC